MNVYLFTLATGACCPEHLKMLCGITRMCKKGLSYKIFEHIRYKSDVVFDKLNHFLETLDNIFSLWYYVHIKEKCK